MNGILNIKLAGNECRCFLNSGTFCEDAIFSLYHKHQYAEIHVVLDGEMVFHVDKEIIYTKGASAVLIPAFTYHYVETVSESVCHSAFQIDFPQKTAALKEFPMQIIDGFFSQLRHTNETQNHALLSPYISLLCTTLFDDTCESIVENFDYAFIINEFFAKRYNENISVETLAKDLKLSKKHTQRLVIKHTGKTFGQNLFDLRMKIADYLIENTDMNLTEIAEYVGYGSYAGFFKARKKKMTDEE